MPAATAFDNRDINYVYNVDYRDLHSMRTAETDEIISFVKEQRFPLKFKLSIDTNMIK